MSHAEATSYNGPGPWRLDPDGAAVHDATGTAVVADLHLGYEWARGRGGDCLPAHSLAETLIRLDAVRRRAPGGLTRLIVAGDLVESPHPCPRTSRDVASLRHGLTERGIDLVVLHGNHDPPARHRPRSLVVQGWTIAHGHEAIEAPRTISGHHHPVLRAGGLTAHCFLIDSTTIILPAFSRNAAGVGLQRLDLSHHAVPARLRCIATAGEALLDFGPIGPLLAALS